MRKYDLWVIDKDNCPDDDLVIMQGHCIGCQHYRGFKVEYGLPCVICSFYVNEDKQ